MDVDAAFLVVGVVGSYQKRAVAVLVVTQVSELKMLFFIKKEEEEEESMLEAAERLGSKVYMAFQAMLIVLVGSTPEFHIEQQDDAAAGHHFTGLLNSLFFEVVFGYMTALAPNYWVFAVFRLLVGMMNGGIGLVCFVLTQEYVGKSYWAMTELQHLMSSAATWWRSAASGWST